MLFMRGILRIPSEDDEESSWPSHAEHRCRCGADRQHPPDPTHASPSQKSPKVCVYFTMSERASDRGGTAAPGSCARSVSSPSL